MDRIEGPAHMHKEFWLRKVERPDFETLKKDVQELGYTGAGRKYGVSDNAVRKWIRFYQQKKRIGDLINLMCERVRKFSHTILTQRKKAYSL